MKNKSMPSTNNRMKQLLLHEPAFSIYLALMTAVMGMLFEITITHIVIGYFGIILVNQMLVPCIEKTDSADFKLSILHFAYRLVFCIAVYTAFLIASLGGLLGFQLNDIPLSIITALIIFFACSLILAILNRVIAYYITQTTSGQISTDKAKLYSGYVRGKRGVNIVYLISVLLIFTGIFKAIWDFSNPISDNPHSMSLLDHNGKVTVDGYINNGTPVYQNWTANLAGLENLSSSEIDRINHFLIATFKLNQDDDQNNDHNITLFPVCAAIDEKGNLNILYHNNDGKVAVLNNDLRQLLQK